MALRWSWEGLWKVYLLPEVAFYRHRRSTPRGLSLVPLKEWSHQMRSPLPAEAAVRFSGGCQLVLWYAWCQDTHHSCPETCPWAHLFFLCQVCTGSQVDPLDNFLALNAISEKTVRDTCLLVLHEMPVYRKLFRALPLSGLNRHKPRT